MSICFAFFVYFLGFALSMSAMISSCVKPVRSEVAARSKPSYSFVTNLAIGFRWLLKCFTIARRSRSFLFSAILEFDLSILHRVAVRKLTGVNDDLESIFKLWREVLIKCADVCCFWSGVVNHFD